MKVFPELRRLETNCKITLSSGFLVVTDGRRDK